MAKIKEGKGSVTILGLIGILVITAVFGLLMLLPAAYAEADFELADF